MEIVFLLIPVALVLIALVVGLLFWAVRSGQFEDMTGPAYRVLMDDDSPGACDRSTASDTDSSKLHRK
ncbi:MAG: cbb3-type cytochrome oxidase assembly protein CcoS [Gammaproteobacteria bacterium]|nr:cbb3-type cytochrome oxidase assembly protein CcoS [Gammaproteobacteria bacterium]